MTGARVVARHRRWGWGCLALFALAGLVLESMHGFKLALLLEHETRRTMWRLAHAHGALLGLVHLALASQLASRPGLDAKADARTLAVSRAFCVAAVCLPGGFALGGLWFHQADPGLGIALVPLGGVALVYGCLRVAFAPHKGS